MRGQYILERILWNRQSPFKLAIILMVGYGWPCWNPGLWVMENRYLVFRDGIFGGEFGGYKRVNTSRFCLMLLSDWFQLTGIPFQN